MAKENETIADIIAEMLMARTEFPFVYIMGEPDTPEVVDFTTKKIIEPRKINIRRVTVQELAHRLKSALKRERGDCAKLRKALKDIGRIVEQIRLLYSDYPIETHEIARKASAALAAPARNCDVYNNESCRMAYHLHGDGLMTMQAFADWLFAPATDKEGVAK